MFLSEFMGNAASVGTTLIFELRRPGVDLDLLPLPLPLPELADSVISQAAIAAAETEETLLGWAKYST
ncbi:MAG: ABC-type transport system involved in cytochrome c biogenesis permease component, partial [Candidatus Poriferisodalaceae bacterium]